MAGEDQGHTESSEQRQKHYEELYRYARAAYEEEKKRVEDVELKASRFFPLIVLLLGVGAIGIKETIEILKSSPGLGSLFFIPYFFFYITSICSIFAFLWVIAIRTVESPPIGEDVIKAFDENQYLDIIYSYSHDFFDYTRATSEITERKYEALKWAYRLLVASVLLAFMSTLGYIITRLANP